MVQYDVYRYDKLQSETLSSTLLHSYQERSYFTPITRYPLSAKVGSSQRLDASSANQYVSLTLIASHLYHRLIAQVPHVGTCGSRSDLESLGLPKNLYHDDLVLSPVEASPIIIMLSPEYIHR